jgi:two-component system, NarL family, response regulator DevR
LIMDHHPALRAGVKVVLEAEADMVVVGDTGAQDELLPLLRRTRPDVVLLDCHPPAVVGLRACRLIKCLVPAPRVLIYTAYADERLRVAARVAGADGVLGKNSSALDLVQAIRVVHGGRQLFEPIRPGDVQRATRLLDPQDAQILEMLLDDTTSVGDRGRAQRAAGERRTTSQRHRRTPLRRTAVERGGRAVRPPRRVARAAMRGAGLGPSFGSHARAA